MTTQETHGNSDSTPAEARDPKSTTVVINGDPVEVTEKTLDFWAIIRLAFPDATVGDGSAFVVSEVLPSGTVNSIVAGGKSIHVRPGLILTARHAGNQS
jgi:hypothetical protein